jgi:hypothetical protein
VFYINVNLISNDVFWDLTLVSISLYLIQLELIFLLGPHFETVVFESLFQFLLFLLDQVFLVLFPGLIELTIICLSPCPSIFELYHHFFGLFQIIQLIANIFILLLNAGSQIFISLFFYQNCVTYIDCIVISIILSKIINIAESI